MKTLQPTNIRSLLAAFIVIFAVSATTHAQQIQSDYQVQQAYREEVASIKSALEDVDQHAEAQKISERVESLESEYSEHADLINKAVYPDTFEEQISRLESRATSTQNQLATIEEQEQKVKKLTSQLEGYGDKLARMSERTDSLQTAVQKSVESEEQLSEQLRNYRQNLQQRDELILSFIDSVIVTYQNMDIETIADLENARTENRLEAGENPLKMIRAIPSESMQLLESNSQLAPEDYLRMKTIHTEFSRMWDKVGRKFTEAYSVNPQQTQSEIKQSINKWEKQLNDRLWSSIDQSFNQVDIDLKEFNNSSSLYDALNTYVEQGLTQSQQDSDQGYQKYTKFSEFWNNQVKEKWTSGMIETDLLSSSQIATIDQKTNQWATIAEPESNMLAYLLGVSVLTIAVLGIMLFRVKSKNGE